MDLSKFTRDELIMGSVALLLVIDLLFLPWFEVSVGIGSVTLSASSTATSAPDGWLGVIAVLASLGVMADLALERRSSCLPGGSRPERRVK